MDGTAVSQSGQNGSIRGVPLLDLGRQHAGLRDEILAALGRVCDSGGFVLGPEVTRLEQQLAGYCGVGHAVGCASGSDALLLALMALDVGPGDEVILPSFTFFATASAVTRLGARPVFADIDPRTFNLDPAARGAADPAGHQGHPAGTPVRPGGRDGRHRPAWPSGRRGGGRGRRPGRSGPNSTAAARARSARSAASASIPPRTSAGRATAACSPPAPTTWPTACGCSAATACGPATITQLVGINSRLDSFQAAVLNVKLAAPGPLDRAAAGQRRPLRRAVLRRRAGHGARAAPGRTRPAARLEPVRGSRSATASATQLRECAGRGPHRQRNLLPAGPAPAGMLPLP